MMRGRAKALRRTQTEAEWRLWYHLRANRFMALKFKRQEPIGHYIVDFVCPQHSLIIELDGGQHAETIRYDEVRTQWLAAQGFKLIRFWNDEVLNQTEAVLDQIRLSILAQAAAVPSPSGEGGPSGPGEGKGYVPDAAPMNAKTKSSQQ